MIKKSPIRPLISGLALTPALALIFMLSACQPAEEANPETPPPVTENTADTQASSTEPSTATDSEAALEIAEGTVTDPSANTQPMADGATEADDSLANNSQVANSPAPQPDSAQAVQGEQITEVTYEGETDNSQTLKVTFKTSASGILQADVTLPDGRRMTLDAPEGQGNNPTYHSKDGSVELVSHGGGGNVDLIMGQKISSFQATSAEAEVVTAS